MKPTRKRLVLLICAIALAGALSLAKIKDVSFAGQFCARSVELQTTPESVPKCISEKLKTGKGQHRQICSKAKI